MIYRGKVGFGVSMVKPVKPLALLQIGLGRFVFLAMFVLFITWCFTSGDMGCRWNGMRRPL